MKWIYILIFCVYLSGCSSRPYPANNNCNDPVCKSAALIEAIIITSKKSRKCSDMDGDARQECEGQVKAVKRSINKAKSK